LKHAESVFETPPTRIIFAYGIFQKAYQDLEIAYPNLILHRGLPEESYLDDECDPSTHTLLILDDLLSDIANSKEMTDLFIRGVHHKNITTILIYQNIFYQSKYMRTISLNLSYYVLMRNYRDQGQIRNLARQMFLGNGARRMVESYMDCTSTARGYLLITNLTVAEEEDRLVTQIFPDDECLVCYLPK
jgi:hypothetical protein